MAACGGLAKADEDPQRLIDGIISRASAIHSIQLTYTHRGYVLGSPPADIRAFHGQMTVDGRNWALRYDGSSNFGMQRGPVRLSFVEIESAEHKQTFRTLYVEGPRSLEELINASPYHAAPRLGTLWYSAQVEFIDRNRERATLRGTGQLDGHSTVELEWPVAAADFDEAMLIVPESIARAGRGRLRLCVAPELGYALPRIQYVGEAERVEHEVMAGDFVDEGGGVYFPRRVGSTTKVPGGDQINEFVIHQVTNLNTPVPPATFSLKIPLGTRISDSRPGVPAASFELQDQKQLQQLNQALADPDAAEIWNRRRILLTLNSVCFLVCLTIYAMRRCLRSS
jgi:hypothetical protein